MPSVGYTHATVSVVVSVGFAVAAPTLRLRLTVRRGLLPGFCLVAGDVGLDGIGGNLGHGATFALCGKH